MRLTIVGQLKGQLTAATRIAMDRGAAVTHAETVDQAMRTLRAGRGADLIMVDVALDVRELIAGLEAERFHVPVVACGVDNDARAAVAAIQSGAKEYIPLPPDPELIAAVLAAVADDQRDLVFRDPAMIAVVQLATQIAGSAASVLITGESGSGKEMLARHVHQKSLRANKPFVSVNCAAIPEQLLESELFGHEKGAFTGASARRIGKFEEASGGTLLLDEISEMDVRLQAKLLRALQERVIDRVGGSKPVPVDIRVIATSNRVLADEVRRGTFREDLLYRLNVVTLKIPPLRDRPSDILELATHFAKKYAVANGMPVRPLSAEARAQIARGRFPGNVRELENTIHRAVLLASGPEIGAEAILSPDGGPMAPARTADAASRAAETAEMITRSFVGRTVADVERELILDTLGHTQGNRTHAANILGISIRTLRNKLNQYDEEGYAITPPQGGVAAA
ncbi:sigma-54-dependent Fis family transcriptional regulator [Methylopila jiangsuensis]|uniref:Sigma-54-dependent Fis family transcriptional regulator n=1 Tax=Methylopila jiangsuensis TaxID=586230 RepID=A0A9W6JEV8_9HYPH|nr:sigma-54 dependent transcriptional regulator [Methylopila jiangsuensis]MDR6284162.1 DNA-binding NtrC family response regulator [Methylopila jiangsuensis]GLK76321.1 sigma-54-dependent Fis family transcriptional regulator [Methylopila jiangsuensis]